MYIRIAQHSDKSALENFLAFNDGEKWRDLARGYIDCMFSQDFRRPTFLVALEKEEIIGSAAISEEFFTVDVWGISWVNVHPDWRKQGIGEKLVEACFEEIRSKVSKKITVILNTYPNKTGLYDKTGFALVGHDCEGGGLMVCHLEQRV